MSLKLHLMHFYFDFFRPENRKAVSDEHGERFYQDISKWKRGTLENGVKTRWVTTAGVLKGDTNWQVQEAKEGEMSV